MALPAWSFVVVGLAVSLTSAYIGEKLRVFLFGGLILLMYGVFRSVRLYVVRGPSRADEDLIEQKTFGVDVMQCPYCAVKVYSTAKFCHECGGRILPT